MNYYGYGKLQSADIRWNMRKNQITRQKLAAEAGIPDQKLQDILSQQYIPDEYAEKLMDAIFALKKRKGSMFR